MKVQTLTWLVLATMCAGPSWAMERDETCTLQSPLPIIINRPEGRLEATLDRGVEVTVLVVGDEGRSRVTTGDAAGSVATRDLEAACAGTLQVCRLEKPVVMYAKTRSDSQAWRLKPGATLSVLRSGKAWAHARVDDLEGFINADELKVACRGLAGGALEKTAEPEVTEEVERGEGPGVLFLPLLLDGAAPAASADSIGDLLFERLAAYRPDAARLPLSSARTAGKWRAHVETASARARAAGFAYVLVGKLGVETVDGKGVLVLSTAMVDARASKIMKGVRMRPTMRLEDPWPEQMLATLLPLIADAPGGKVPVAPRSTAPSTTTTPTTTPKTVGSALPDAAPWFANPWGYLAAGGAVAVGAGAGVAGWLALDENTAANATTPLDVARGERRERALQLGIASDALTAAAVVTGIATVVVFASRAGMDDSPQVLAQRAE